VSAIGLPIGHDYMSFTTAEFAGTPVVVCRTGYTGERGYELVVPNQAAVAVFDALLEAGAQYGIVPAGLGARDTLRTEMGYPLHGQDITPDITPVQARSGWAVGWKKDHFWGDEALRAEKERGPARILRGLRAAGRGIPRPHMTVLDQSGTTLGEVTSGTMSPCLGIGVGMAYVPADRAEPGTPIEIDVRGKLRAAEIATKPLYSKER